MKTMEEYLDEIADMVMGADDRLYPVAEFDDTSATLRVLDSDGNDLGQLTATVVGENPVFDSEHACFNAGVLVGLAISKLGRTEIVQ